MTEHKNTWDPEFISDVSERVYHLSLNRDNPIINGKTAVERMLERYREQGEEDPEGRLRRHGVHQYRNSTRTYLEVLGFKPTKPNDRVELDKARS